MLKKSITYTTFDGETVTEDHYFHLSKAQIVEKEAMTPGGYGALLQRISKSVEEDRPDGKLIMETFNDLVNESYGVKSEDGRRFIRGGVDQFRESPAYDVFFIETCTDADKMAEFVNGIMPAGFEQDVERMAVAAEARKSNVFADTPPADKVEAALGTGRPPVAEPITSSEPRILSRDEAAEMDGDELRSGLATGRYQLS